MIAHFIATEAGTTVEESFLATGVRSTDPPHYLLFSRWRPIGHEEDWSIELEFDDQINSNYDKIKRCSLRRDRLHVELIEPIDHQKQFTVFDVELRIGDAEWNQLRDGLRYVFTGRADSLSIET